MATQLIPLFELPHSSNLQQRLLHWMFLKALRVYTINLCYIPHNWSISVYSINGVEDAY